MRLSVRQFKRLIVEARGEEDVSQALELFDKQTVNSHSWVRHTFNREFDIDGFKVQLAFSPAWSKSKPYTVATPGVVGMEIKGSKATPEEAVELARALYEKYVRKQLGVKVKKVQPAPEEMSGADREASAAYDELKRREKLEKSRRGMWRK